MHEQYAGQEDEWRHELRVRIETFSTQALSYLASFYPNNSMISFPLQVRYIPTDLQQLFEKDKVTFYYYYDQVIMIVMVMTMTS